MDYTLLGRNIRICWGTKGLTQEKLAELSHISVKHISKIELGKVNLKVETLVNLANALDVAIDTLLCKYVTHSENISVNEINRYIAELSPAEKDKLRWLLEKNKEIEKRTKT